jgi:nitrite reductase (NADH) small subunit
METNLGCISRIPPGEGREFDVDGRQVAVFRTRNGEVFATQAACPHRQGPLADGLIGGSIVACPFHAWKFDLATGEVMQGKCSITCHRVRVDGDGILHLTLAAEPDRQEDGANAPCKTS